jgi:hypothetical protein
MKRLVSGAGIWGHSGPVFDPVTRSDNEPAVGDSVIADFPVENELESRSHYRRGCKVDLVQEQDAVSGARQEAGGCESGQTLINEGKTTDISRGELVEPKVDHLHFVGLGYGFDDRAFSDARSSPHHHGGFHTSTDKSVQVLAGLRQVGGEHGWLCT